MYAFIGARLDAITPAHVPDMSMLDASVFQ